MNTEIDQYEQQANDFLNKTGAKIEITFKKYDYHFEDDKDKRDIYSIYIGRGKRGMSFDFGQSLNNSGVKIVNRNTGKVFKTFDKSQYLKKDSSFDVAKFRLLCGWQFGSCDKIELPKAPTNYDILACLTKYDPETFEDFCANFGYDEDSRKALKIYEAVKKEFTDLCTLFNDDELSELSEIN